MRGIISFKSDPGIVRSSQAGVTTTFSIVPNSGKGIVYNLQTFPKRNVIPEADEGGYQESLTSVTVHSNKLLVNR